MSPCSFIITGDIHRFEKHIKLCSKTNKLYNLKSNPPFVQFCFLIPTLCLSIMSPFPQP